MTNYQNGKIYKIEDVGGNLCYIGSTTKLYLSHRMATHRGDYRQWLAGKGNKITVMDIFEKYGVENCKIVLIELYPCDSKDELHKREAHYITTTECVNKNIPGRTLAEYNQDNKERIQAHKSEIIDCECGNSYTRGHISQHMKGNKHKTSLAKINTI